MVNAFRYGMLGASDVSVGVAFTIILASVTGLFVLALLLLQRGIGIRA
jgi:ABC-2 type transport system permease protein